MSLRWREVNTHTPSLLPLCLEETLLKSHQYIQLLKSSQPEGKEKRKAGTKKETLERKRNRSGSKISETSETQQQQQQQHDELWRRKRNRHWIRWGEWGILGRVSCHSFFMHHSFLLMVANESKINQVLFCFWPSNFSGCDNDLKRIFKFLSVGREFPRTSEPITTLWNASGGTTSRRASPDCETPYQTWKGTKAPGHKFSKKPRNTSRKSQKKHPVYLYKLLTVFF